ncbi:hypothetical protein [Streptomyces sp. NPDC017991]|uniref:hypothetical protein n=1 Tax=Streptomyces sp. NPDC017991 TaxID=3365026 RepID=UPI0037B67F62
MSLPSPSPPPFPPFPPFPPSPPLPPVPAGREARPKRFGRRGSHASAGRLRRPRSPRSPRRFFGILRRTPAATPDAADRSADRLQRLGNDLSTSRAQTARWKRHADAYARERDVLARERAYLLSWLAALHPSSAVVSQAPTPDGTADGRHVLSLVAGGRPLSWTVAPREVPLFQHVPRAAGDTDTRAWRDAQEVEAQYAHIHRHTRMLALEDDLTRVVEELRGSD